MEPEGSVPCSQKPATGPYPDPAESIRPINPYLLKVHLNVILPPTPRSSKWSLPSGLPTKTLQTPLPSSMSATCPAPLILFDLITPTIFGEKYIIIIIIIIIINTFQSFVGKFLVS
jgi:hypothetical protein